MNNYSQNNFRTVVINYNNGVSINIPVIIIVWKIVIYIEI